jgi:beta-lactamase regulating signal transducer with metallopeptidase domain
MMDAPADRGLAPAAAAGAPSAGPVPRAWADRLPAWTSTLLALYAAGVAVLLLRLAVGRWLVHRLARSAADVSDPEWRRLFLECAAASGVRRSIRLLRARESTMPLTFGVRRPTIVLPSIADTWSDDRRRAVLLHEMAHVARHDCLTQMMAALACALYWPHPGVWWVAHRLRMERELACDDRVLQVGTCARDYAGHLLDLAYALGGSRVPALAVTMARPRQLEGRMLAILDGARNRTIPGLGGRMASLAITVALLVPLATASPAIVVADDGLPSVAAPDRAPYMGAAADPAGVAMGQTEPAGTWEINPSKTPGIVNVRVTSGDSSSGFSIEVSKLEALTGVKLSGTTGPVRCSIRRDAGTFNLEGTVRNGVGAGTFTFAPDPAFAAELAKRGYERPTSAQQFALARADVGYAFLDELNAQRYTRPGLSDLVRAGQHGVSVDYLRGMGAAGYHLNSLGPLIELRDHGVTPEYVRQLADLGYKGVSPDDLRRARDHGVTPEHVRELRDAGYTLTLDQLVQARDHGVAGPFARALAAVGPGKPSIEELIRLRDHGVTPEYVKDLRDLGYSATREQLTLARDHGVTPQFVRDLVALGHRGLTLEALIRLRDHGVTPDYAKAIKDLGYEGVEPEALVRLRDRGVTPDGIRRANARAGTRLPLDMLEKVGR